MMKKKKNPEKESFFQHAQNTTRQMWKFFSEDIWKITETEVKGLKGILLTIAKTLILSIRRFSEDNLQTKASALTYNTLLAIIPILALLFAIANGFGFQNIIESQLFDYLPAQREALNHAKTFIDAYLKQTQSGGLFVGIGLVMLLWTIISMVNNIESSFNEIWQIKKSRSIYRKVTDYTSIFIILPILMIASSGVSIFISSNLLTNETLSFISPILMKFISFSPYILTWLLFTGMYIMIPNTKVKFLNALFAGIICGSAFQIFQFFYISGQIWVSKYNAIYGSFAFLPLLLLWLQISWLICLFGAELTFTSQNIRNYDFEQDAQSISRRYRDFLTIIIASVIIQRFEKGEKALTSEEISYTTHIPIKLTVEILYNLIQIGTINETATEDERIMAYQPALDINQISVGSLMECIDNHGTENLLVDKEVVFNKQWEMMILSRQKMVQESKEILLKDLIIENTIK